MTDADVTGADAIHPGYGFLSENFPVAKILEENGIKFIEVGQKIKKGDTVMIVEAMKTMNHVPSPLDGVVKEISVEDGQPVEFGQTIAFLD
jgi:biotin carboxyl carrier protein